MFTRVIVILFLASTMIFAKINKEIVLAVKNGDLKVIKKLINKSNINTKLKNGDTILLLAIKKKRDNIARFLINNGADVNIKNKYKTTPLMSASYKGSFSIVKLLVSKGANLYAKDRFPGWTPLIWATSGLSKEGGEHLKIIKFLISKGVKGKAINVSGKRGDTALKNSARWGNLDAVKLLVENGADINFQDSYGGWTALTIASSSGSNPKQNSVIKYLIKNGADVNLLSRYNKYTSLMLAASNNNLEAVKVLVENGAKLNFKSKDKGFTALMYSAYMYSGLKVVKYLISKGANLKIKDKKGRTILEIANKNKTKEYIRSIIKKNKKDL